MQLQVILKKIHEVRGQKIMLDFDLAQLYEVETRALNQAVKRNIEIFPDNSVSGSVSNGNGKETLY